mmetsp:Transcript_64489/g.148345  ORF Transcript_64489/g.148345 Transcript_64489/m.148345 type:complete len:214 (-) Transcript_64489:3-644(-)
MILLKIRHILSSSRRENPVRTKCPSIRGVINARPPPGTPMAANSVRSMTPRNGWVTSLRSYHPPEGGYAFLSISCRKISIGGWAPYFSILGMFRSSTITMECLPGGGPYTPFFRRSSLPSTMSCVWSHRVCAENPMKIWMYSSLSRHISPWLMYTVFPVPVGPQNSSGRFQSTQCFMMYEYRMLSSVSTTMDSALSSLPKLWGSARVSIQFFH